MFKSPLAMSGSPFELSVGQVLYNAMLLPLAIEVRLDIEYLVVIFIVKP